jgi:putative ABC transport system substrate-binding protein
LVASLSHPGGNVTGVSILNGETGLKRLELARELFPQASTVVMLVNPNNPNTASNAAEVETAVRAGGQQFRLLTASSERELNSAFAALAGLRNGILIVVIDAFFNDQSPQIVALAARYSIPAFYHSRVFIAQGGLMSFGGNVQEAYRQAGIMAAKILRGTNPAEIPVQQSVSFELLINLKTAKALGLTVPPTLLSRADEIIE